MKYGGIALKVVVVEDTGQPGSAIRNCLERELEAEVIGNACDGITVADLVKECKSDIILFGVNLADGKRSAAIYRLMGTEELPTGVSRLQELLSSSEASTGHKGRSGERSEGTNSPRTSPFRLMGKVCEIRKNTGARLEDIIIVAPHEIMFAETRGHTLYVHTLDAVVKMDSSLQELNRHLRASGYRMFFQCHKSYLINLRAVKGIRLKVCDSYGMSEVFFPGHREDRPGQQTPEGSID